jgi:hypothetical protein
MGRLPLSLDRLRPNVQIRYPGIQPKRPATPVVRIRAREKVEEFAAGSGLESLVGYREGQGLPPMRRVLLGRDVFTGVAETVAAKACASISGLKPLHRTCRLRDEQPGVAPPQVAPTPQLATTA